MKTPAAATAPALAALGALAFSCSSGSSGWEQQFEPPRDADLVIETVASFPECEAVREAGVIQWRPGPFQCSKVLLADGCAWPTRFQKVVEVNISKGQNGSAWDTSLAHELCHLCGYLNEAEASACALRARDAGEPK
jgi:hypothetical protein